MVLSRELKDHILKRAGESNIDASRLGIEINEDPHFEYMTFNTPTTPLLYQVYTTYAGAVDEEFAMVGPYEVNVADWIVEFYRELADNPDAGSGNEPWTVEVYYYERPDGDSPTYIVRSDS